MKLVHVASELCPFVKTGGLADAADSLAAALAAAGVKLGDTYPPPIVDHRTARAAALAAFRRMKSGAA